jgi:GTPase
VLNWQISTTTLAACARAGSCSAMCMQVVAGQTAALALKKIKRTAVRKGMVLVDEKLRPHACWEFNAEIAILTHSTTIQPRYQVGICSNTM